MKTNLIDTNVLIRFFVGDNKSQQNQAQKWFLEAKDGRIKIIVSPIVVAETCFVLESFYKKTRLEISEVLLSLLSLRWIKVEDRTTLLSLWPWYLKNFHFVDSFLLARAKLDKIDVLTFDQKISKEVC